MAFESSTSSSAFCHEFTTKPPKQPHRHNGGSGGDKELVRRMGKATVITQLKSWCKVTVGKTPALEDKTATAPVDHRIATLDQNLKTYLEQIAI